ncbi:flavin reductase family protein [Streptomyces coeruleorubidus]|uniref:flavin reductase family protein n=1 Tax=Streptomyces coeruleorubidus TaxID=116188 RepID=UPI0037B00341
MTPVSAGLKSAGAGTGLRAPVAPAALRDVMSQFATGVVVLTVGGDGCHAMTANAFTSVSLTPPTVLCSVAHSAVMYEALRTAGHFGVSVLGAGQEPLARHFADKSRPLGAAQFDGVGFRLGEHTGAPLLDGALAWLECELSEAHDSGDHTIFVGAVQACRRGADDAGLLFFDGRFDRTPR